MDTPMSQLRGDLRAKDRFGVLVGVVGEPATTRMVRCSVLLARLLSDAEIATLIVLITRTGESAGEQRVQVGRRLRADAAPGRRSRCADAL
jgi:hypothetical protein